MSAPTNEIGIQIGSQRGKKILIIGESPAKNGWIISKRAFYTPEGRLFPTGKRLNVYLEPLGLSVEVISFTELVPIVVTSRTQLPKLAPQYFGALQGKIEELNPRIVITLGVIANQVFESQFHSSFPIGEMYYVQNFKYFPIYHPSPASPYGHKKNLVLFEKFNAELEQELG